MTIKDVASSHLAAGRTHFRTTCPQCSHQRKPQNQKETVLSCSVSDKRLVYCCHHCGWNGYSWLDSLDESFSEAITLEDAPAPDPETKAVADWLGSRYISLETAQHLGCAPVSKNGIKMMSFPFYDFNGKKVACKYRHLDKKEFTQDPGGKQILFGLNQKFDTNEPLIIVEGEMDVLTLVEIGVRNAVSVPGGGMDTAAAADSRKFEFLNHAKSFIAQFPCVLIGTDNDKVGNVLADELAKRIGVAKCKRIEWREKDANQILIERGIFGIKQDIELAQPFPIPNLFSVPNGMGDLIDMYRSGAPTTYGFGYDLGFDDLFRMAPGQVTVITGTPGSGKSTLHDQLLVKLSERHGLKHAMASFENPPITHLAKLCSVYSGKPFYSGPVPRMSEDELAEAVDWVNGHFSLMEFGGDELPSIDSVLTTADALIEREGIKTLTIDPYNYLHQTDESEHEFVRVMLTKVAAWAKNRKVHVFFVAHPKKMMVEKGKVGVVTPYDIAGSSHWFNIADNILSVYRNNEKNQVEIHVQKIRFTWVGKLGCAFMRYEVPTGRYEELGDPMVVAEVVRNLEGRDPWDL